MLSKSKSKKYAVLIGCNKYPKEEELDDLRCPPSDVKGLKEVLLDKSTCNFDIVNDLVNRPRHEAEELINSMLTEATHEDLVLIYYSGHGKPNKKLKLHLAMSNTVYKKLESTSIPISTIKDYVNSSSAGRIILILDCCYSGRAGEVFLRTRGGGIEEDIKATFESEGTGRYIMTASTGIEVAEEKESEKYSVFTGPLIEGLRTGEADLDGNGWITMNELYNYIHSEVKKSNLQTPTRINSGAGEIIIAKSKKGIKNKSTDQRSKVLKLAGPLKLPNDILFDILEFLQNKNPGVDQKNHHKLVQQFVKQQITSNELVSLWKKVRKDYELQTTKETFKVLSLDGGGMQTIGTAHLLNEIELRTKKSIHELFDLITGTSFSGLLTLFLTMQDKNGLRIYTPKDYLDFFYQRAGEIFHANLRYKVSSMKGLTRAKYENHGIDEALRQYFGDLELKDTLIDIILPAYELKRGALFYFRSKLANAKESENFKARDVGRAVTATPTLFTPAEIVSEKNRDYNLIDASVLLDNPVMVAYSEISRMHQDANYLFISVGTKYKRSNYHKKAQNWGMAKWIQPLINIASQVSSDMADDQIRSILPDNSYYRFAPYINDIQMDDFTVGNVEDIKKYLSKFIHDNNAQIDELCDRLVN